MFALKQNVIITQPGSQKYIFCTCKFNPTLFIYKPTYSYNNHFNERMQIWVGNVFQVYANKSIKNLKLKSWKNNAKKTAVEKKNTKPAVQKTAHAPNFPHN